MTSPASDSLSDILSRLDARVRRVDEERWLSSRYAPEDTRVALTVLYAFYYELARVRVAVSDGVLGQIRFQWWRDALEELSRGEVRQHDVVFALEDQLKRGHMSPDALLELVDRHETAFLEENRDLEPEDRLAQIAVRLCAPDEDLDALVAPIAPVWAGLRRQEPSDEVVARVKCPAQARPALAHFSLRHAWARGKSLSPFRMRLAILKAVWFGQI